jgi:signal transduction histidine kinase
MDRRPRPELDAEAPTDLRDLATLVMTELERRHAGAGRPTAAAGVARRGGVAHDFNNLLTIISLNLEIASDELDPQDPRREFVAAALEAAIRGIELNNRLLAFAAREMPRPVPTDIDRFLVPLCLFAQRILGERHRLVFVPHPQPGRHVSAVDPAQLEAAILHLLINARDAVPDGGIITLQTASAHIDAAGPPHRDAGRPGAIAAGDYVVISVDESGPAADPAPDSRPGDTYGANGGGAPDSTGKNTGLGMVRGFVRQSGGHVDIERGPDRATSVRLYLPVAGGGASDRPDAPDPGGPDVPNSGPSVFEVTRRGLRA